MSKISSLKNILVLRSFSKEYFMTGWRIGYLIGDENIIKKIQLTNETIISCLPPFIQIAAIKALDQKYDAKYSKFHEIIKNRRDLIYNGLKSIKGIEVAKPNSSFYIFQKLIKNLKILMNLQIFYLINIKLLFVPVKYLDKINNLNFRMCYASVNNHDLVRTINIIEKMLK